MTRLAILLTAATITSLAALYFVLRLLSHEEDDYRLPWVEPEWDEVVAA